VITSDHANVHLTGLIRIWLGLWVSVSNGLDGGIDALSDWVFQTEGAQVDQLSLKSLSEFLRFNITLLA